MRQNTAYLRGLLWGIKGARVYKVPSLALLMTHYGHPQLQQLSLLLKFGKLLKTVTTCIPRNNLKQYGSSSQLMGQNKPCLRSGNWLLVSFLPATCFVTLRQVLPLSGPFEPEAAQLIPNYLFSLPFSSFFLPAQPIIVSLSPERDAQWLILEWLSLASFLWPLLNAKRCWLSFFGVLNTSPEKHLDPGKKQSGVGKLNVRGH